MYSRYKDIYIFSIIKQSTIDFDLSQLNDDEKHGVLNYEDTQCVYVDDNENENLFRRPNFEGRRGLFAADVQLKRFGVTFHEGLGICND